MPESTDTEDARQSLVKLLMADQRQAGRRACSPRGGILDLGPQSLVFRLA